VHLGAAAGRQRPRVRRALAACERATARARRARGPGAGDSAPGLAPGMRSAAAQRSCRWRATRCPARSASPPSSTPAPRPRPPARAASAATASSGRAAGPPLAYRARGSLRARALCRRGRAAHWVAVQRRSQAVGGPLALLVHVDSHAPPRQELPPRMPTGYGSLYRKHDAPFRLHTAQGLVRPCMSPAARAPSPLSSPRALRRPRRRAGPPKDLSAQHPHAAQ